MSLKEASNRLKRRTKELREEVKGTVEDLAEAIPHPLAERKTIFLREPIIKRLMKGRRERKA